MDDAMNHKMRSKAFVRTLMSWTKTLLIVLALMLISGALRAPTLPDKAPDFTAHTLEGKPAQLSDLKGRPVLLNFWATWCAPCRFELPALSRLSDRHPELVIWGLSTESVATLKEARERHELSYPVMRITQETLDTYAVSTFPTTLFLTAEGEIRHAHVGVLWDPLFEAALWGL